MSRVSCCLIAVLGLGCDPAVPTEAEEPASSQVPSARPSVLVITLDTTRADALTPYGAPSGLTPTASRLAAEGVRFDRAYTVTPLTIPAHSSLFTGLWPPRHGVRDNGDHFLSEEADTLAERLQGAGYATMAAVGAEVTSAHWGFGQGFDTYFDDMGEAALSSRNRWAVERPAEAVVDDAMGWLRARSQGEPWFAWVHVFDAHHPYRPHDPSLSPDNPYLAEVGHADRELGRIIQYLDESGQLESTWVVMLADHGEALGAHGERTHGVLLYDDTTRIPLIVRPPGGLASPAVLDFPATIADVAPSLVGALGLPMLDPVDGADLSPWLREPTLDSKLLLQRAVYLESLYGWHYYGWAPQRAVVDPRYKLIDSTRPELYARDDVGETLDLAAVQSGVVGGLRVHVDKMAERMTPVLDATVSSEIDAVQTAQLQALGYIGGGTQAGELVPFRGELEDPISRMPIFQRTEAIRVAVQSGDLAGARRLAEEVLEREPGMDTVRSQLIRILEQTGDLDAAEVLLRARDAERSTSSTRFALAQLLMTKGDVEAAMLGFEDALRRDVNRREVWVTWLRALFVTGQHARFESELDRAATLLPGDPLVDGFRGVLALLQGDGKSAEPLLEKATHADAHLPLVHHALGVILLQRRDLLGAQALFRAELRADPSSMPARQGLVSVLGQLGEWERQLTLLADLARATPGDPRVHHSMAVAHTRLHQLDDAHAAVKTCMQIQPVFSECHIAAADIYQQQGKTDEARAAYDAGLAAREVMKPSMPRPPQ